MTQYRSPRYGRFLEEFEIGAVYEHPWEVTVDAGILAFCAGSFLDAIARLRERALCACARLSRPSGAPAGAPELRAQLLGARRLRAGHRAPRVHRRSLPERVLRGRYPARVEHRARREAVGRGRARRRARAHGALDRGRAGRLPLRAQGARQSARDRRAAPRRAGAGAPRAPRQPGAVVAGVPATREAHRTPARALRASARRSRHRRLSRLLRRLRARATSFATTLGER